MNEINGNGQPDSSKPKRFPGVASFEDNDLANELFFGREVESQKLLHYILAESLVIVFSYSGYGKTSLLQASIFKKLREKYFFPLLVRFNKKEFTPQELIKTEFSAINEISDYEVLHTHVGHDNLTDFFKNVEIWSPDDKLATPVIILDQFEEIFTLEHNQKHIAGFFEDLAVLLKECREAGLNLKLVISIREDFLGHIEKMSVNIPSVFSNRFRLETLNKETAAKAIDGPPGKELNKVEFASPPFSFSQDAKNELLDFLSLKLVEGEWKASDEIEPIQLQIVCSEIENRIISGEIKSAGTGSIIIETSHFNGRQGLKNIVANFYDRQIAAVQSELHLNNEDLNALKDIIEKGLIVGKRRVPLAYDAVINMKHVNKNAVDLLIKNKLLRFESHHGNTLIEISHDTLIEPISKSLRQREELDIKLKKRKKIAKRAMIAAIILLVAGAIAYFLLFSEGAVQDRYYYAALMGRRENPTLAYKIALDGSKIGLITSKKIRILLNEFDSSDYAYIVDRFVVLTKQISASIPKNNQLLIIKSDARKDTLNLSSEKNRLNFYFNRNPTDHSDASEICEGFAAGKYVDIFVNEDSIIVKDDKSHIIKKVKYSLPKTKTEKEYLTFYANEIKQIFDADCSFKIGSEAQLMYSKSANYLILYNNDEQHEDDEFLYFDLAKNTLYSFNPSSNTRSKYIPSTKQNESNHKDEKNNPVAMAVAVTRDLKKLVVSTPDEVKIWDISNIDKSDTIDKKPVQLVGHTGTVNSIAISPGDSLILTGGSDNLAILWNFKGERKALLKGHKSKIVYVNFSDNGKELLTQDEQGNLFIWKLTQDINKNELDRELVKFSPFEYRSFGLAENSYSQTKLYGSDTVHFNKILFAALHYRSTLPSTNIYPDDNNYRTSLQQSVSEVETLYEMLFRNKSFDTLTVNYKENLYDNYFNLITTPADRLKLDKHFYSEQTARLSNFFDQQIKSIDAEKSIYLKDRISEMISEAHNAKNYDIAVYYCRKKIYLSEALQNKDKREKYLDEQSDYIRLSFHQLFARDFKGAIKSSEKAISLDTSYLIPYTNLALGYLLNDQPKEAEAIYIKYKIELHKDFLQDFSDLENAGIISASDQRVKRIREILGE